MVNVMNIAGTELGQTPIKSFITRIYHMPMAQRLVPNESRDIHAFADFFLNAGPVEQTQFAGQDAQPSTTQAKDTSDPTMQPVSDLEPSAASIPADISRLPQTDIAPLIKESRQNFLDGGGNVPDGSMHQIMQPHGVGLSPRGSDESLSNYPLPSTQGTPNIMITPPTYPTALLETVVQLHTPEHNKGSIQAGTITNIFPQRADAPNPLPVTTGTADNIFRKSPIAVSGTSRQGTNLRGGIRPLERDVTAPQITKRNSQRPLTMLQTPTAHVLATRSNGPVLPMETIIPDKIAALADDPNDLARTILRDLGSVQHTGQTQTRPPFITQMAHALPQNAPQTRETYHVDLTPKDLGSVRMSLIAHDGGITITIQCDVDSTAQLARRHSDHLVRDLMDMGYTSVDIDVAGQQTNNHNSDPSHALANNQVKFDTHDKEDLSAQQDQIGPYHAANKPNGIDIKV